MASRRALGAQEIHHLLVQRFLPHRPLPPRGDVAYIPLVWTAADRAVRGNHNLLVVARLKPGVNVQTAQAEMTTISKRLEQQYPADDKGWGAVVLPLHDDLVGDVRAQLFVLLGAVAFVLLIACANLANLFLAKGLARGKELAVVRETSGRFRLEYPVGHVLVERENPVLVSPRVSPDGKTIAFITGNRVWLIDRDGKNLRQFFQDGHNQQRPVFSPDGTRIAMVICNTSAVDMTGEVFVIDRKTQEITPLRTSTGATLVPDTTTRLNWVP